MVAYWGYNEWHTVKTPIALYVLMPNYSLSLSGRHCSASTSIASRRFHLVEGLTGE